jgi:hypothetical protein
MARSPKLCLYDFRAKRDGEMSEMLDQPKDAASVEDQSDSGEPPVQGDGKAKEDRLPWQRPSCRKTEAAATEGSVLIINDGPYL